MQEKAKEPEIRFAGFTGAWEQRKLSDIAERITRKNTHLESTLPLTISSSYGLIDQYAYFNNRVASRNTRNYYLIKNGEFAYNKSYSDGFPFGSVKRLDRYAMGVLSTLYIIFSIDYRKVNSDFLVSYYDTKNWHHQVALRAAEGARNHGLLNISADDFFETELKIPMNLDEQKKIGSFFDQLNSFITLHQRKYEKLLNIKKSMLEKMFPKEGEVVPEIRFKGFTGAWEQRKFSKLYKRSSEKNDGSIGIERNITVATMQFKSDIRLSSDDYLKTYFTFKVGDIAFEGHQSKEFRYGRFVENDIGDGVVSHIFTVFRPIQRFDLHFWKYAISSENLMQKILSRSTKASTMMHDLVPEDFLNETFLVPSIDEQKAVGKFLHQIDNLLTLHQRKLEMLKNVKQAFLEKMFV